MHHMHAQAATALTCRVAQPWPTECSCILQMRLWRVDCTTVVRQAAELLLQHLLIVSEHACVLLVSPA